MVELVQKTRLKDIWMHADVGRGQLNAESHHIMHAALDEVHSGNLQEVTIPAKGP